MDDRGTRNDFWSIEGNYIHRHHVEPRDLLFVSKEETFPIPMRYIDVVILTHTTLDVLQECRIDDCRNIDASRNLSDSWTGFTQFTILNEEPPDIYRFREGSGLQKFKQPQDLIFLARNLVMHVKKQLNEEKSSNGIWRNRSSTMREKLRGGIYFTNPDEFKETIENARKKLELPLEAAMPCKVKNHQYRETCGESDIRRSMHACIVEAHYNLVHKFIPMFQAMKIC